jgi:hypothetical protein
MSTGSTHGEMRNAYKNFFVGNPQRERPLSVLRCRWQDGIKMDPRETGRGDVNRIELAQDNDQW